MGLECQVLLRPCPTLQMLGESKAHGGPPGHSYNDNEITVHFPGRKQPKLHTLVHSLDL